MLFSQIQGIVDISMRGRIQFMVTDSVGYRTGVDSRTGILYQDIPNTGYGIGCCGSIDPADSIYDKGIQFSFLQSVDSLFNDQYTLSVFGLRKGLFQYSVNLIQTIDGKGTFLNEFGVIDSLQTIEFKINYSTDSTVPPTVVKIVDVPLLIQDLNNCYGLNLVKNQSLYQSLTIAVTKADSLLHVPDTVDARFQLLQFDILLDRSSSDTSQIDTNGYKILKEDIGTLFSQLPTYFVPSTPVPQYTLTINVSGAGSVTRNPNQSIYDSAETVQLTATPSTGYSFAGWSGDASGQINPLSLLISSNKTVTATFIQSSFAITASAGANGTISPSGTVNVNFGASQIFTITPNAGYHIDSVFVDNIYVGNLPFDTINNVTGNHSISAKFAINQYTITASAGSSGSISPAGNLVVNYGSSQTFTFTPNTGYYIDSLIVDGVRQTSASSYTFSSVTANRTIRATFKLYQYTITASSGSNGSLSPSGNVVVNYGSNQTFTFTPNTGYYVDSLIVDGVQQTSASSYIFNSVTANHTIRVTFSNQYTLTIIISGGGGTVTQSPKYSTYSYGTTVTLTAHKQINGIDPQIKIQPLLPAPKEWDFDHWELDASGTTNPTTITMNGNKTVRAVFVAKY